MTVGTAHAGMSYNTRTNKVAKLVGVPSSGTDLIASGILSMSQAWDKVVKLSMSPVSGPT